MLKKLLIILLILSIPILSPPLYSQDVVHDPWEGYNRFIFKMNDKIDVNFAEPVASAYDYVTPNPVIKGVSNLFYNLDYPSRLVSDVLQLKFGQALVHTGRFLINSTVGIVGLIDVAEEIGLEKHHEDMGTAFANWGIGPGAYVVMPFYGPRNMRDVIGYCLDTILSPLFWVPYFDIANWSFGLSIGVSAANIVNLRATLLEVVETAKASALDYYLFSQSAYYQFRNGVIYDGNPPGQGDDWLDEEEDEDWLSE